MLIQDETVCYDRVFTCPQMHQRCRRVNKLYGSGFHLTNDLVRLYHMINYLNRYNNLSKQARQRVKWFDYYHKRGNVSKTCGHFDISRKTFYKWKKQYNPKNLFTLGDKDTTPINKRQREITSEQEKRIVKLRKKGILYSKIKLAKIYEREYQEKISSWKVQKVIELYKLYHNPIKTSKLTRKRLKAATRRRITELKKKPKTGFLLCFDTIEIRWNNLKRFIFTGIDSYSKVAFARMYKNSNSYNAADFLNRMLWLVDGKIENIQTDNGSEFEKYFSKACKELELTRYYSRPRTPKDNPVNERFNRTIEDEFINLGNFTPETKEFNHNLTEWLVEYNFHRPHMSLNYETPINFNNSIKVSPMYPSDTGG